MINGFANKKVHIIAICIVCVLVVAAMVYGFVKSGRKDINGQNEDLVYDDTVENMILQERVLQESHMEDALMQADLEQMLRDDDILGEEDIDETVVAELSHEKNADVLKDKKLSILGDSISTYEGWIPEGYVDFFPMNGEIDDVDDTWWKMLIDDTEMQFCANSSSAGSTCVGDSLSIDDPKFACSNYRINDLVGNDGVYPDIIIVYMGTNDVLTSVPLGENDGLQLVEEGDIETFSDAYSMILDKLESQYPGAQIFCCTLVHIGDWGNEKPFITFVNSMGLTSEDYSKQIETIADNKGLSVIDLQNCGITIDNMHKYVTDGVHLNVEGMKLVRDAAEEALIEFVY